MKYIYTCINEKDGEATTKTIDIETLSKYMESADIIADNLCITFVIKNSSGNATHSYVIRGEREQK